MHFDLDHTPPGQTYALMSQAIVPRPIAWVLSGNDDGGLNLAPFSYFNAVCSNPPLIMVSIGHKPDGSEKDTRANILQRRHFVVHIAHHELLDALNASAATLPARESELQRLGLPTEPLPGFPLPRLQQARIAMACELYQAHELGPSKQALILGRIRQLYASDTVIGEDAKGRPRIDSMSVMPLARLGGPNYATLGEQHRRERPE